MCRDQGGIPPPAASLPKAPHDMPRSAEGCFAIRYLYYDI